MKHLRRHAKRGGFTMIEALVVLALIAILTALALPNYREAIRRSQRAEARLGLLKAAYWLEQVATATGSYLHHEADFPVALKGAPSGVYAIDFKPTETRGSGYTLTATPRGAQAGDRCGSLTLDQAGLRGLASPSASDLLKVECWTR